MLETIKMALLAVLLSLSLYALVSLVQNLLRDKYEDAIRKMAVEENEKGKTEN